MCDGNGPMTAVATAQLDDAALRITRYDFAPGAETGWHRHAHPYVVVPLVDGVLRLVDAAGEKLAPLTAGVSYARPAGVEHNVINAGEGAMAFVEIEMKRG